MPHPAKFSNASSPNGKILFAIAQKGPQQQEEKLKENMPKNAPTSPIPVPPSINPVKPKALTSWRRPSITGLLNFKPLRLRLVNLQKEQVFLLIFFLQVLNF